MKQDVRQIRFGIIADDLTGATDAVAAFANCGFTGAVAFQPRRLRLLTVQVIALSTNSRHDVPSTARRKVRRACAHLRDSGLSFLYKKVDSTGQGNIVAEVESARAAGKFTTAVVCLANPAQGRMVRDGVLNVRSDDTVNLHERFRSQGLVEFRSVASPISEAKITSAIEQGHRFILADATSERDLARLISIVLGSKHRVLLAGSAGMARELAKLLMCRQPARLKRSGKLPLPRARKDARCNTLIMIGSNNPVTERQLRKLIRKTRSPTLALKRHAEKDVGAALANGRNVVIRVPVHRQSDIVVFRHLCDLAPLFRARLVGSLLLSGGDTALLACRSLNPLAIAITGEITPGLAWGRFIGGLADGLTVCTKPGGFGTDQSLVRAVDFLARETADALRGETHVLAPHALGSSRTQPSYRMPSVTSHTIT